MLAKEKNIRVLIICDQSDIAPLLGYMLRKKGLNVSIENSIPHVINHTIAPLPDLVLIDVNASHSKQIKLIQEYRALMPNPILLFLPAHHEVKILEAYQAGVDECIVKPVSPAILLAKVNVWARRSGTNLLQPASPSKKLTLNPARRSAKLPSGKEVHLTHLEFRLLNLLTSRPGYTFTNDEIILNVWGSKSKNDQIALKNVIYRLRKKLNPKYEYMIQTSPGGYNFRED